MTGDELELETLVAGWKRRHAAFTPNTESWYELGQCIEDAERALERLQSRLVIPGLTPTGRQPEAGERARCRAGRDGECNWRWCPQLIEKEPETSRRSCPLIDPEGDYEEGYEAQPYPASAVRRARGL